jgi:(p)ppGpp synthase/HD superfamily hydrolase
MTSVLSVINKYPDLNLSEISDINIKALLYAKDFLSDPFYHKCCLLSQIRGRAVLKSQYSKELKKSLRIINRIIYTDPTILTKPTEYQNEKIIYLCLLKAYLEEDEHNIRPLRAEYCLKLLKTIHVSKVIESLTDSLFAICEPTSHQKLDNILIEKNTANTNLKKAAIEYFESLASDQNLDLKVTGRIKSLHSIFEKLQNKSLLLNQILDFIGIRIITKTKEDCFKSLSLITKKHPVLNNRLKDYITIPKPNGYQSIHTTIFFKNQPIEVQIRTEDMHNFSEYGDAAHNKYKNDSTQKSGS